MRRHGQHGWQWTRTYTPDGSARYAVPRRSSWDLRCEEAPCAPRQGRMSARWPQRRARWRAGGLYRSV
jgi:hypothetical protein